MIFSMLRRFCDFVKLTFKLLNAERLNAPGLLRPLHQTTIIPEVARGAERLNLAVFVDACPERFQHQFFQRQFELDDSARGSRCYKVL
jgi:hypothetical protein